MALAITVALAVPVTFLVLRSAGTPPPPTPAGRLAQGPAVPAAVAPAPAPPLPPAPSAGYAGPSARSRPIFNSVGMRLVRLEPGTFLMGSPPDEADRHPDETRHEVRLTKPFCIGATEVTQAQWNAVMGAGDNPSRFKGDDLPVERVSWGDAVDYCDRLGRREGKRYRLPTEAEWEYACRAGGTTAFPAGETITPADARFKDGRDGSSQTAPAGRYPPNRWGLYDATGNVWEWCGDWYGTYPLGPLTDPAGPAEGDRRVVRGGSWLHGRANGRSACRYAVAADSRVPDFGFRVVLEVGPSPAEVAPTPGGAETVWASAVHRFPFDAATLEWAAAPPLARDAAAGRSPAVVVGATLVADGRAGDALTFGAPGRRVEVPDSPVDGATGGLSLAAWVRLDRPGNGSVLDRSDWGGGPTRGYVLRVIGGRADFTVGGDDTWHTVATDQPLPVGRWVHLAATYDGRVGVVYVDGRPAASGPLPRLVPSRQPLWVGSGSFEIARERAFPGALDEVGVFDRPLSAGEVRRLASAP